MRTIKVDDFVRQFAGQFEETDAGVFSPETRFHDLDEWSSLLALSVLGMVDDEYDVQLKLEEMRQLDTVGQLCELVISKQR